MSLACIRLRLRKLRATGQRHISAAWRKDYQMGIILGLSLFIGVLIGVLISILFVTTAVIAAVKGAKRRMHVWRVFLPVAIVSMTLLILGVYHYPYNTGTPGSNYSSLFGHSFFVGLAYAAIPGVSSVFAFLTTLFCPRDYSIVKGGA